MGLQYVTIAASWLEIIVGGILLIAPDVPCMLVFGGKPDGVAAPVARFAGIALIGLCIACLPSKTASHRHSLPGLFVFNAGAAVLFTWLALLTSQAGVLAWPVAILHAGIAAALLLRLLSEG